MTQSQPVSALACGQGGLALSTVSVRTGGGQPASTSAELGGTKTGYCTILNLKKQKQKKSKKAN